MFTNNIHVFAQNILERASLKNREILFMKSLNILLKIPDLHIVDKSRKTIFIKYKREFLHKYL